jgi:hypothetical protein
VQEVKPTAEAEEALADLPDDSQLTKLLSPDGMTELFRIGGGLLPPDEVKPGDDWNDTLTSATPFGELTQEIKYEYAGAEKSEGRELHKLTLASTSKLAPKPDAEVKLSVQNQTGAGEVLFDAAAGYVVSGQTKVQSQSSRPFRDVLVRVNVESTTMLTIKRE